MLSSDLRNTILHSPLQQCGLHVSELGKGCTERVRGGNCRLLGHILELLFCRACANASPQDMNDAMIGISSQVSHRNMFVCVFVCVCVMKYVCMHVCMCVCDEICLYACLYVCVCDVTVLCVVHRFNFCCRRCSCHSSWTPSRPSFKRDPQRQQRPQQPPHAVLAVVPPPPPPSLAHRRRMERGGPGQGQEQGRGEGR